MYVFVRDGIWAFFIMFGENPFYSASGLTRMFMSSFAVILLLNLLMFKFHTSPLAPLCFKWALSIVSFTVRLSVLSSSYVDLPATS